MKQTCVPCRTRHLKCDHLQPVCTNCMKARSRQRCVYQGTRFRQSRHSILAPVSEPSTVETPATNSTPPTTSAPSPIEDLGASVNLPGLQSDSILNLNEAGCNVYNLSGQTSSRTVQSVQQTSQRNPLENREGLQALTDHQRNFSLVLQLVPPSTHGVPSPTGIEHASIQEKVKIIEDESRIFDFYLQHPGVWLDIVSYDQCFAQIVPHLATHTPVLYQSCLAYASRIMALWGKGPEALANDYHYQAIRLLIPLLDPNMPTVASDVVLATTVLLRMLEQFSEPTEDAQCHLNGAFGLFTNSESRWPPDRVDIQGVSFWVFVRQSLRICFLFEQECRFDLSLVDSSDMLSPARDDVWTNRMTFLLAKVCHTCWSPDMEDQSMKRDLDDLETEINSWRSGIPDTFEPWYFHQASSMPFPTIRYFTRWHAIGWQQYYTAKTMIAVYRQRFQNPSTYHDINDYLKFKILVPAQLVCGVVFSERDVGVGINGAHLASWCGQFFTGVEEQRALLDWLKRFMERVKWPNQTTIDRLQKSWGTQRQGLCSDQDSPPAI